MVARPKRDTVSAETKRNQSIPRKPPRGPRKNDAPVPPPPLPFIGILRVYNLSSAGGTRGRISILPTGQLNASGHVNTMGCFSPAFSRDSDVIEDALALPAGSKMTATNDRPETGATDLFSAIAVMRGEESTPETSLLITDTAAASFFNRSHTRGPENSKYVCATARLPVLMLNSYTGVTEAGMINIWPARSAMSTFFPSYKPNR